jgi:hypothetical protein
VDITIVDIQCIEKAPAKNTGSTALKRKRIQKGNVQRLHKQKKRSISITWAISQVNLKRIEENDSILKNY